MEMSNGSEHRTTETYMIPATSSNQHLPLTPTLQGYDTMASEVAPQFIVDQGLYYPAAPNYYGYYSTGFKSPGEWDDRHRFFGLDGHDLHYSGMQTETSPYVYYTPSYAYAHSLYNPYNPYIPGAIIGVESPFVGTHYIVDPAYQQPVSSPAYFPVVQSGSDAIPSGSPNLFLFNTVLSGASRPDIGGVKYTPPPASVGTASIAPRPGSGNLRSEPSQTSAHQIHSSSKISDGSQVGAAPIKQPTSHGTTTTVSAPPVTRGGDASGSMQAPDQSTLENASSVPSPLKVTVPTNNGSSDFGPGVRGCAPEDRFRPTLQNGGALDTTNGSPDMLGEQNRGPRTSRSKGQWTSSIVVKAYTTEAGACNAQGNIIIYADQYNREDFPVNYPDAKFFVIKSYTEDDVHKSIKYNIWSSTPSGNKRLDSAYEDAQRISRGDPRKCPVFLFFSVNASGQFCGVAEMIGPVDFNKDMDFWQQDKWTGCFPVEWRIIKDVPNTSFRHIILENNENKPVTNSRDTQEIRYIPGMSMLNIFKNSPTKTSILDDFMYYEDRQRIMHEEKSRLHGKGYDAALFLPASSPPNKPNATVTQPLKTDEKPTESNDNPKSSGIPVPGDDQVSPKLENDSDSSDKKDAESDLAEDANGLSSVMKIGSLSIGSKEGDADQSMTTAVSSAPVDVVIVGSIPVKVNGYGESSSGILTVGTIVIDPKAVKHNNLNVPASNTPLG